MFTVWNDQALVTAAITGSEFRFVLRSTAGIAFLGTPHRGTKMQSWASKGAAMLNILGYSPHTGILDDLKEGAPRLQDVLHEFCLINNTLRIPIMCFFELYETDYGNRFGIPGVAKGLVRYAPVAPGTMWSSS